MIYFVVVYSVIGMIRNYVFQVSGKRKDDNLIGNKQNMDAYNMFEVNGLLSRINYLLTKVILGINITIHLLGMYYFIVMIENYIHRLNDTAALFK